MVNIRTKYDILDDAGEITVPGGSAGSTLAVAVPPRASSCHCQFLISGTSITKWIDPDDLIFADGPIGYVRAMILHGGFAVADIKHPNVVSDVDYVSTAGALTIDPDVLDVVLVGGVTIRFNTDFNQGSIVATLLGVTQEEQVVESGEPDSGDLIVP